MDEATGRAPEAYKQDLLRELARCEARTLDRSVFLGLQRVRSRLEMGMQKRASLPVLKQMEEELFELRVLIDRGDERLAEPKLQRLEVLAEDVYREIPRMEEKAREQEPQRKTSAGLSSIIQGTLKRSGESPESGQVREYEEKAKSRILETQTKMGPERTQCAQLKEASEKKRETCAAHSEDDSKHKILRQDAALVERKLAASEK